MNYQNKKPLTKFKQHLKVVTWNYIDYVYSYSSAIAKIDWNMNQIIQIRWWNPNQVKHINYIAKHYNLKIRHEQEG